MTKSISFLLGAGFSAPIGYPTGEELNKSLVNCTGKEFAFNSRGTLTVASDGKKPNFGYKTSWEIKFEFCLKLIKHFNDTTGDFDYEQFYYFLKYEAFKDQAIEAIASPFLSEFETVRQLISSINPIYSQLVGYYLKDGQGKYWYEDSNHIGMSSYPGYNGILNCFKKLSDDSIINVHTLNHDLFFERLNRSDWFSKEITDGFEELGSPYFGELHSNGGVYKVRLSRYTGRYEKIFRLYKLHGSRDYGIYYSSNGITTIPEMYIKTRFGIGFGDMFKEVKSHNEDFEYEYCWINYHADFLTGTTSK